ncbi:MAG TPA: nucleotide exchange factor GrpE, partial [Firmicutes bacterium]|nr:nucleotide exchange factor GrpE [Bacillota bacterium]
MTKKHDGTSAVSNADSDAVNTIAATQENVEEMDLTAEASVSENPESGQTSNEQERISALEAELQQVKQDKNEYYNRMLRTQADLENFRRRSRQEVEQLTMYAGEDLMKKILPVLDSLERAISCFSDKNNTSSWQEGVDLTLKQFQAILKNEGLEVVPSLNGPFNPQLHEAVLQEPQAEVTEPIVIEEMQKGYRYKEKLLR